MFNPQRPFVYLLELRRKVMFSNYFSLLPTKEVNIEKHMTHNRGQLHCNGIVV